MCGQLNQTFSCFVIFFLFVVIVVVVVPEELRNANTNESIIVKITIMILFPLLFIGYLFCTDVNSSTDLR